MKSIASRDNATFKHLKKLADSGRERRKSGQALLDGVHLVEAAQRAGLEMLMLVVSESGAANVEIAELLGKSFPMPVVQLADGLFAEISPVETPVGVAAMIAIPSAHVAPEPQFALLLDDVQDPGNLGSLMRSAAAAGVEVVWLSTGCADAWSPKALRAGMGAHFSLAIEERVNLTEKVAGFAGLTVATSLEATQSLYELDLTGPVALLVGNEGAGLSADLLALANTRIRIPMPGAVESLNVAAAAAVCLFERVRQLTEKVRGYP